MPSPASAPSPAPRFATLDLFCKVVDNYGDIGICWRLARQLAHEHALAVRLWVDDLATFRRICPQVMPDAAEQSVQGVTISHWRSQDTPFAQFSASNIPDIVVEFFGCEIPPAYVEAMAQRPRKPLWFNLEGLSAETWVEGCHTLPSPHRSLKLTKYFFFPGFNPRTGGLTFEADLQARRHAFQDGQQAAPFLARLGVTPAEMQAIKVSLFCYDYAPLAELFDAWQHSPRPVTCLVPDGVAPQAIATFLGTPAQPGAVATRGALTLRVVPFVPQPEFDQLLWSCDLNFVRGEDSIVRAQWAARPFIWNIYKQDKNLHHTKLNALLGIHSAATPAMVDMSRAWNGANSAPVDWKTCWQALLADLPAITAASEPWCDSLLANGDFMANLLRFAAELAQKDS